MRGPGTNALINTKGSVRKIPSEDPDLDWWGQLLWGRGHLEIKNLKKKKVKHVTSSFYVTMY